MTATAIAAIEDAAQSSAVPGTAMINDNFYRLLSSPGGMGVVKIGTVVIEGSHRLPFDRFGIRGRNGAITVFAMEDGRQTGVIG